MSARTLALYAWLAVAACGESGGRAPASGGSAGTGAGGGTGGAIAGDSGTDGDANDGSGASSTGGAAGSAGAAGGDGGAGADASMGGAAGAATAAGNAMWVWKGGEFVDDAARGTLLAFAKTRGVSRLFVNGYPALSPSSPSYAPAAWRKALEDAALQSIAVEVLLGEPTWTSPGAAQSWAIDQLVVPLAAFVTDPATKVKPAALHFDVEPHGIAGWSGMTATAQRKLIADLCDFFALTRQKLDAGGATALRLHADLPSWWDSTAYTFSYAGQQATGYAHALSRLDAVALMAYSNQQSSVLANSSYEVDLTDAQGKRIWIGVETDPAHPSDAFLTKTALGSALAALDSTYASHASYAGWAVHEYAFFSVMP